MQPIVVAGFVLGSGFAALQGQGASVGGGSGSGTAVGGAAPAIADGGLLSGTDPTVYYAIAVAVMAIAVAVVVYPLVRAWAKRMEQRGPANSIGTGENERMRQLEQSVEALTLEIERISEGQRYTTKLLTERLPLAVKVPQPGQSEKTLL